MKNMKHYKLIAASLAAVVCLSSCDKFLTEAPTTSLSESSVYNTEAVLEANVIGIYSTFQQNNCAWQQVMLEIPMASSCLITWKGARTSEDWVQTKLLTLLPNNGYNTNVFNYCYGTIYRCNKLLENLPDSPVDQTYKNEIEGEVRFLRAWCYYCLARFYGDVPLILNTPKSLTDMENPRTPYQEVYKQVLADLEFAEQNMRTPERQTEATGTTGRPHKWAATAMKSSVYLQIACLIENKDYQFFDLSKPGREPDFSSIGINSHADAWQLSLDTAESVIKSGAYQLEPDYANLFAWGPDNPSIYNSKERVFVLTSTNGNTNNVRISLYTMPQFPEGTLNTVTKNNNWARIRPGRFVLDKWFRVHLGSKWSGRKDKLTDMPKTWTDPRVNIAYFHTSYKKQQNGAISTQRLWPNDASSSGNAFKANNPVLNNAYYDPCFKKYFDTHFDATKGYADFYLMRYAEVYLIAAEAAASLSAGPGDAMWQKAMDYMEVIHERARKSGGKAANPAARPTMAQWKADTKEKLIEAIMWERIFELHGEGHEFFDTHRRGAKFMSDFITKPLNAFLQKPEQNLKSTDKKYSYYSQLYDNWVFEEDPQKLRKAVLFSFPEAEMRTNSSIGDDGQNDFYYASMAD